MSQSTGDKTSRIHGRVNASSSRFAQPRQSNADHREGLSPGILNIG
jgi:hypothetical protein